MFSHNYYISKHSKDIFSLQKTAIKAMFQLKKFESCKETFIKHQILTVPCIYIFEVSKFVKKNYEKFQHNTDIHTYNTRRKNDPRPPKNHKDIRYTLINIYNNLPSHIKDMKNFNLFKKAVKKLLLKHQFYTVSDYHQTKF